MKGKIFDEDCDIEVGSPNQISYSVELSAVALRGVEVRHTHIIPRSHFFSRLTMYLIAP